MNHSPFPTAARQPITPTASPAPRLSDCAKIILASRPELGRHYNKQTLAEHVETLVHRLEIVGRIEEERHD